MSDLKPLLPELIPQALQKAERYRLLNEPAESESICQDVLAVDPGNQQALICLLLSLTDQIALGRSGAAKKAREVLPSLAGEYERTYYLGVICERTGKARLRSAAHGSGFQAYEWLRQAMEHYDRAEGLSAADNDDAKLRWNSCVRMMEAHPELRPEPEAERVGIVSE